MQTDKIKGENKKHMELNPGTSLSILQVNQKYEAPVASFKFCLRPSQKLDTTPPVFFPV